MKPPKHPSRLPTRLTISRAGDEACRQDFVSFIRMSYDLLPHGEPLSMNGHIEAMAYHLEQVRRGRIKRLIINLPPRYLKSVVTSVAFPAFVLGHDPTKRLIVASYGSELAVKLANDCRTVINSPRYKSIFPGLQISRMKNTESEIATTRGGFRLATSIDGSLTGRGGHIMIIDDPLKPSDACSDAKRDHVNTWFKNTLYSRLDDKQKGAIIIVMQRLHDEELQDLDDKSHFLLKTASNSLFTFVGGAARTALPSCAARKGSIRTCTTVGRRSSWRRARNASPSGCPSVAERVARCSASAALYSELPGKWVSRPPSCNRCFNRCPPLGTHRSVCVEKDPVSWWR